MDDKESSSCSLGSEEHVPIRGGVGASTNLPFEEQQNFCTLNDHIRRNIGYLALLPTHQFQIEPDNIHWAKDTGKAMFSTLVA